MKWTEYGDEPPGWYRARVDEYFLDKSCKIVYDSQDKFLISEVVSLHEVEWKPCSKRAKKFVPIDRDPVSTKSNWKPSLKFVNSMEHSLKGYADDVTLLSSDMMFTNLFCIHWILELRILIYVSSPQNVSHFCLMAPNSYFKGYLCPRDQHDQSLRGKPNFWEKLIDVSLSATKKAAGKRMINRLTDLLTETDLLPIRGEYKLWIYRNYIISLLRFHLRVDAVSSWIISRLESIATRFLKKWLRLPRSASRVILYYPGVCCPSITHVFREAKLSLLSCVSVTSDPWLQELGLQLHLGNVTLQINDNEYSILANARKQLSVLPSARSLYLKLKLSLHSTINLNVKITCRHSLSNPSLVALLNWKAPARLGIGYWLGFILANYHFSYEPLLIHSPLL